MDVACLSINFKKTSIYILVDIILYNKLKYNLTEDAFDKLIDREIYSVLLLDVYSDIKIINNLENLEESIAMKKLIADIGPMISKNNLPTPLGISHRLTRSKKRKTNEKF
jgi:hypothetical protein